MLRKYIKIAFRSLWKNKLFTGINIVGLSIYFSALSGDMKIALAKPNSIVLVKSWAEKCFDGWENTLGKTVLIDNVLPFTVTGVLENLPERCDFQR